MDKDFIDILQKLIAEQGKAALLNQAKSKSFLADYTKSEYKKESRLLLQALDVGVAKALDTAKNIALCKKQQVRVLQDDCFLVPEIASDLVDTLALVLRGDTSKTQPAPIAQPGASPVPQAASKPSGASSPQPDIEQENEQNTGPNDEEDFDTDFLDDGYGHTIVGYHGKRKIVQIPSYIKGSAVTAIGPDAFRGRQLSSVAIPNGLRYIKAGAFMDNQLISVSLPNSILAIRDSAFMNNKLSSVIIPKNINWIEVGAFANNQLSSVTVPAKARRVEEGAFDPGVTITRR